MKDANSVVNEYFRNKESMDGKVAVDLLAIYFSN